MKYFEVRHSFYANEPDVENGPSEDDIGFDVYCTESESEETARNEWLVFANNEGIKNKYCWITEITEKDYNDYLEYMTEETANSYSSGDYYFRQVNE